MKTLKSILLLILLNSNLLLFAQNTGGGEFKFNETNVPCLTQKQRVKVIEKLNENKKILKLQNKYSTSFEKAPNPLFIWPVQQASDVSYNEIWAISNYVDHNPAFPNQITDYKSGTKSYDTDSGYNHQGIDIFIWPYSWKMMDEDGLEVIAASGGQIVYKNDGEFDQSCSFNSNQWNAVFIRHNDGSAAWYGHLKNGSLTNKSVGDFVIQGEYLGIVGSSGNSTGPHLHFEVYEDDSYSLDKLIDPYIGPSNNWNTTTWWQNQKAYRNSSINALTTNSNPPNLGNCPSIESTNEESNFTINDLVYFTVFLKDQFNEEIDLRVYKPDNSLLYNWHLDFTQDFAASYYWLTGTVDTEGQWRLEATLSTGQIENHYFNVDDVTLSTNNRLLNNLSIYPNPTSGNLNIQLGHTYEDVQVVVRNILGQQIMTETYTAVKDINMNIEANSGTYFVELTTGNQRTVSKVLKQ